LAALSGASLWIALVVAGAAVFGLVRADRLIRWVLDSDDRTRRAKELLHVGEPARGRRTAEPAVSVMRGLPGKVAAYPPPVTGAGRRFPYDPATLRMAQEALQRFLGDPAMQRQMRAAQETILNSRAMADILQRSREAMAQAASPAFARQMAEAVRALQTTDPGVFRRLAESYRPALDEDAVQAAAEDLRSTDAATVEEVAEALASDLESEAIAQQAAADIAESDLLGDILDPDDDAGDGLDVEDRRAAKVIRVGLLIFVWMAGGGLFVAGVAIPGFGMAAGYGGGLLALCMQIADKIVPKDK